MKTDQIVYLEPAAPTAILWRGSSPYCPNCDEPLDSPGSVIYCEAYEACISSSSYGTSVEYASNSIDSQAYCRTCERALDYEDVTAQA